MAATVNEYGWATPESFEAHREIITNLYFYQVSSRIPFYLPQRRDHEMLSRGTLWKLADPCHIEQETQGVEGDHGTRLPLLRDVSLHPPTPVCDCPEAQSAANRASIVIRCTSQPSRGGMLRRTASTRIREIAARSRRGETESQIRTTTPQPQADTLMPIRSVGFRQGARFLAVGIGGWLFRFSRTPHSLNGGFQGRVLVFGCIVLESVITSGYSWQEWVRLADD